MNIREAYNFKQVDELVSCSGTLKNICLQSLLDAHYDVVINLLPNTVESALEGEEQSFEELGIDYGYIPVNWSAPQYSDFEAFEFLMETIQCKKIHIHCAANYRASAFIAIYAYKNQGWSSKKLSEFINSIWQISEYPVWRKFVSEFTGNTNS